MKSGRSAGALLAGIHGTGGGAPRTNAPHLHAMRAPCQRSWQRSVALPPASVGAGGQGWVGSSGDMNSSHHAPAVAACSVTHQADAATCAVVHQAEA